MFTPDSKYGKHSGLFPADVTYPGCTNMENVIASKELQIERKHFSIEFRENERGRFLRIVEEAQGRRNTIIVPSTGLDEFAATINAIISTAERASLV